jgi:phosphate-selective porin OprO/OprP
MTHTHRPLQVLCLAAALAAPALLHAGAAVADKKTVTPVTKEMSLCESIFDLPTLYKNEENPVIQKFRIIGRYHGQYYALDSNQGGNDDWENRRARIGAEAQLFQDFTLSFNLNLDLDNNGGRFFEDLEDLTLTWKASKEFKLTLGKIKMPITQEWRTSSNKILTFERSRIIGVAVPEKAGGAIASYEKNGWTTELGAFTNTVDEDWAHPTFDGGFSLFGSIARKSDDLGTVRLEYLYSSVDEADNATRGYEHVVSAVYENKWDKIGFVANAIGAFGGDDASDVYGIILMPSYDITDKLQVVARYQFATSDDGGGFSLGSRYDSTADDLKSKSGDDYQAVYAGLNYYLCGHNLKLMTGIEYVNFNQDTDSTYEGWTWFNGVRVSF